MKEEKGISKERWHNHMGYRITVDEDPVAAGDYIFDFIFSNAGANPIVRCDTDYFAELINKEHQKPLHLRRSAKIIASNDPVLNVQGVPAL